MLITLMIFNIEFKYKFKDIYYLLKIIKKIIEITEYCEINSLFTEQNHI